MAPRYNGRCTPFVLGAVHNGSMRVFAALVPPDEALTELETFVEPRRDAEPVLRWTPSHLWHVTLAFMAEVPGTSVDDLVDAVAEVAAGATPIPLRLTGAGAFPDAAAARVVWAGLDSDDPDGLADLERLALRTRTACGRLGLSPAGGTYRPHLTLARSRHPFDATHWLRAMDTHAGPSWDADAITVFASRGHRGGRPSYEAEAICPLGT